MRLFRRLHFYAGILIGPFLLVAAISGGIYALMPTIEKAVYRSALHADSTGTTQSIAAQVNAARADVPDLQVTSVRPSTSPGDTTRVLFSDPALTDGKAREVFVDPVTLDITGNMPNYLGELPVRAWSSALHKDLHLGEPGLFYSELAASWLWLIAVGGIVLWIAHIRKKRHNTGRGNPLLIDGRSRRRERTLNWHGVLGLWIAVFLFFLSATGLTWSEYAGKNVSELRQTLSWTSPSLNTSLTGEAAPESGGHDHGHSGHSPALNSDFDPVGKSDAALGLARAAGVGTKGPVTITYPTSPDEAYTVSEAQAAWRITQNSAAVDPTEGRVTDVNWFADWPLMAKLSSWGINLHMGLLFGVLNQLVLFAVACALVVVIVRGYQMWWQRRRRGSHFPATAPPRGALRAMPIPALVILSTVSIAVGLFIPFLGWTLLAFLVIDSVIGALLYVRNRDRARLNTRSSPSDDDTDPVESATSEMAG